LGKKEALAFLKKNNKSIIKAWEDYKNQVGDSESQLNDVFEKMFKAWLFSNKKAIGLLENKSRKSSSKKTKSNSKKLKPKTSKP
jgi:iron uptake system EfeUOB component EfeO/EfeM